MYNLMSNPFYKIMCVSRYDHEYFLKGVEDFLFFHSIGDCASFPSVAPLITFFLLVYVMIITNIVVVLRHTS